MLVKSIPVLVFINMTRYMYTQSTVLCIPYTVPGKGENQYIILYVYFYLFTSDNNDIRNHKHAFSVIFESIYADVDVFVCTSHLNW